MAKAFGSRGAIERRVSLLLVALVGVFALAIVGLSISASISPWASAQAIAELGRVLAFGRSVQLSPVPTAVGPEATVFTAEGELSALNSGAKLLIDVSSVVPKSDVWGMFKAIEAAFPLGCIEAIAVSSDGSEIHLTHQSSSISDSSRYVSLAQEGGANTKLEFTAVRLTSCREVPSASVEWVNYGK